MRFFTTMAAAVLGAAFGIDAAGAAGDPGEIAPASPGLYTEALDRTLPPAGFVNFCQRYQEDCQVAGPRGAKIEMTGERWRAALQVNAYVNRRIAPSTDAELYGEAEYWTYPEAAGDCEDYVLMKKRYLERLGFPRSALLITVVLDERNDGHALLTLRTNEGDFVLDNRRNDIRRWRDLDYVYLKRQSDGDPREWVALTPAAASATILAARSH